MKEYLEEWENLIKELSDKEIAYVLWKEVYRVKEEEILNNTDFKELYGANNEKVRRNHVKNALKEYNAHIQELEFSINYIKRRISFIKALVRYNTKEE